MYKIEKKPLPPPVMRGRKAKGLSKYPLADLKEVGDSFVIPYSESPQNVRSYMWVLAKKNNIRVVVYEDQKAKGMRVQRVHEYDK